MADAPAGPKRYYRTTRSDSRIAGVCGGLAVYFNMDPTLVRILWVILTLVTGLLPGIVGYVIFWVAAPSEDTLNPQAQPPAKVFR